MLYVALFVRYTTSQRFLGYRQDSCWLLKPGKVTKNPRLAKYMHVMISASPRQ